MNSLFRISLKILLFFGVIMTTSSEEAIANDAFEKIKNGAILIDVRTVEEYNEGNLKNSILIPYDTIQDQIASVTNNLDQEIVLYCRSGIRSGKARDTLKEIGYKNVLNAGGYKDLKKVFE